MSISKTKYSIIISFLFVCIERVCSNNLLLNTTTNTQQTNLDSGQQSLNKFDFNQQEFEFDFIKSTNIAYFEENCF